jgi:transcriptional regulator with XRE-family HTH domain
MSKCGSHPAKQPTAEQAKRLGVAENTLMDWERGKRAIGVTRGVTEDQLRRVVQTVFYT